MSARDMPAVHVRRSIHARPFRRVYRRYNSRPILMNAAYQHIERTEGAVRPTELRNRYGIPYTTARRIIKKWKEDHTFRNYDYSARGHRRIFTQAEEEAIGVFLRENVIERGYLFTDQDFRQWIMQAYLEKYRDTEEIRDFNASNGYIYDFKRRNGFSSRRAHFKRRCDSSNARIDPWISKITDLLRTVPRERILNCDETAWKMFPNGLLTWAIKGSEGVSIAITRDEKECLTALATIRADGTKLPLMIIAKGKTELVEQTQLGDVGFHVTGHSESGWMTQENFEKYLKWIRQESGHDEKLYLILDLYPVHWTDETKEMAAGCNIELLFIPAGCTDQLQPLDVRCFGALKATARRVFRQYYTDDLFVNPGSKITKQSMVQALTYAWEHLDTAVVEEAWSVYSPGTVQ